MGEKTLGAIDWQNQQLDKQTKVINKAASQIQEAGSQISENTSKINATLKKTIKETQDIAPAFVDTKTANILHLLGVQINPQFPIKIKSGRFTV